VLRPSSTSTAHQSWTRYPAHNHHLLNTQLLSLQAPLLHLLDLRHSRHSTHPLQKLSRRTRLLSQKQAHLHLFQHTHLSHSNLSNHLPPQETLLLRPRRHYHKIPKGSHQRRRTIVNRRLLIRKVPAHLSLLHISWRPQEELRVLLLKCSKVEHHQLIRWEVCILFGLRTRNYTNSIFAQMSGQTRILLWTFGMMFTTGMGGIF
jgi:hypothetical protein